MNIEGIYPYIAVAYGTFGIVFGVLLWWKTQRRIDRTKSAIELQVANAVTDIGHKVDDKLGKIAMPNLADIQFDMSPIMASIDERMTRLETTMPDIIGQHIEMHTKSAKAVEAKQVYKALEEMGVNFDAAAGEAMEIAEAQLPPEMVALRKLMTAKIPKSMREANPTWAFIIEQARQAGGGLILSRLQQRAGVGGVVVESAQSGWNPGVKQ